MKNKIEIQIVSPATRQQLVEIRDEIRKLEGLENFNLQIPPAALRQDTMGGGLEELIYHGLIAGVTHFAAEKTLHALAKVPGIFKKVLSASKTPPGDEAMSGSKASKSNEWEVVITKEGDGVRDTTYMNGSGETKTLTNREYSIDPEKTYAVLIGVSDYDDKANFSSIPPVAGNLDEMYRVLSDKRMMGLHPDNIVRIHNETSVNIKTAIDQQSKKPGIETFIVYYAGHGQNTSNPQGPAGNQLSLIAKDTRNIDEELHSDIPYGFIERTLKNSAAAQKIVLLDACHSGLAAQGSKPSFDIEPVYGTFTLASTSAEDASFYKRDAENTYFTSYLLDVFNKGIRNINSMLSLADLYQYTSQQLSKAALPAPQYKADLKNVTPDKFFISNNPGFSIEARLRRPKELADQGNYSEAKKDYLRLRREYPDNKLLQDEYEAFERNMLFNQLVKEGDSFSLVQKNYPAAISKYREALELRYDDGIQSKILECLDMIKQPVNIPTVDPKKKIADTVHKPVERAIPVIKPKTNTYNRRTYFVFGIGILLAIVVVLVVRYWPKSSSNKNEVISIEPIKNDTVSESDNIFKMVSGDSVDYSKAKEYYDNKDYDKAITLATPLANKGYAKAQNLLGVMYERGIGLVKDYAKALDWYQKAADQGYDKAQGNLGRMYEGGYGVYRNYTKAMEWYEKAANQGNATAQCNLGAMYEFGRGVSKDNTKALDLYQRSADQGNSVAQNYLGDMHYYGYGTQRDLKKAFEWHQKSADQGYANAQNHVGEAYAAGEGVEKNIAKAREWMQKSADQGNLLAKGNLLLLPKK